MRTEKERETILKNYRTSLLINSFYSEPKYIKIGTDETIKYRDKKNSINELYKTASGNFNEENIDEFYFCSEDQAFALLLYGNTIYDVNIPKDSKMVKLINKYTDSEILKSDKVTLSNPRQITDEIAMDLYLKSNLKNMSYYKSLANLVVCGYRNTCFKLISDRINIENVDTVLELFDSFISGNLKKGLADDTLYKDVINKLNEIKTNSIKFYKRF